MLPLLASLIILVRLPLVNGNADIRPDYELIQETRDRCAFGEKHDVGQGSAGIGRNQPLSVVISRKCPREAARLFAALRCHRAGDVLSSTSCESRIEPRSFT
jgi:hypothetical protein